MQSRVEKSTPSYEVTRGQDGGLGELLSSCHVARHENSRGRRPRNCVGMIWIVWTRGEPKSPALAKSCEKSMVRAVGGPAVTQEVS